MRPADYLRDCRLAAGLTVEDLALCVDTVPAVAACRRVELLQDIENGLVRVSLSTAVALAAIPMLGVDLVHLAELVDAEQQLRLTSQVSLLVLAGRRA